MTNLKVGLPEGTLEDEENGNKLKEFLIFITNGIKNKVSAILGYTKTIKQNLSVSKNNDIISGKEIIQEMTKLGYQPKNIEEHYKTIKELVKMFGFHSFIEWLEEDGGEQIGLDGKTFKLELRETENGTTKMLINKKVR